MTATAEFVVPRSIPMILDIGWLDNVNKRQGRMRERAKHYLTDGARAN